MLYALLPWCCLQARYGTRQLCHRDRVTYICVNKLSQCCGDGSSPTLPLAISNPMQISHCWLALGKKFDSKYNHLHSMKCTNKCPHGDHLVHTMMALINLLRHDTNRHNRMPLLLLFQMQGIVNKNMTKTSRDTPQYSILKSRHMYMPHQR